MTTLADLISCTIDDPQAELWIIRRGPEKGTPSKTYVKGALGVRITKPDQLIRDYLYYLLEHLRNQGIWNGVEVTGDRFAMVQLQPTAPAPPANPDQN